MIKKVLFSIVLVIGFSLIFSHSDAQCAMCRASVESNLQDGSSAVGGGLNTGILYLMSIPYILFTIIGFFWYKSSKANNASKQKIAV